ncbi:MAG: hypothetical protein LPK45_10675 [Bacteroidota bacterium]|nr:hypothetical protein [Bacteroidota bacterium]MDX5431563.1 hypothetical protein [Bacteroidota bacterium]MDX5470284.1 hypothetical protein [Bacteroidota bacterium]
MPRTGSVFYSVLLLSLSLSQVSCERKCDGVVCTQDEELKIILVDNENTNLIGEGILDFSLIRFVASGNDTIVGDVDTKKGSYNVRTYRDLGHYTLSVGMQANVDLLVYQNFVPSDFECCPGYWRIDSVYARGAKLAEAPDNEGFFLKLE